MSKYKKLPVVINAWPVADIIDFVPGHWDFLPEQIKAAQLAGDIIFFSKKIAICTLEGDIMATHDDMLICGIHDELYPCKMDIFNATYEPVSD